MNNSVNAAMPARPKSSPISVISPTPTPPNQQSPLRELARFGQSVWLDDLSRSLIGSGQLRELIDKDGLSGVTTNPAAFAKAIRGTSDYDADIQRLARQGKSVEEIHEALMVGDVQKAADLLRPVYDRSQKRAGFVSLDMSPQLARNRSAILKDARRLWSAVGRANLLLKVPATVEGLSAIRQLIVEGINVNVTLLFDLLRYRGVLEAWISGLDARAQWTSTVADTTCMASFCLNPIDPEVDPILERAAAQGKSHNDRAWQMRGQTAVSNAKVAYVIHQRFHAGFRFTKLAHLGATPLRLLWAGTEAKNPDYSDLKYVEPLIGNDTVSTVSLETLNAYRDHGHPAPRLEEGLDQARGILYELPKYGIEMHEIAQRLEDERIEKLVKSHEELLNAIRTKCPKAFQSDNANHTPAPAETASQTTDSSVQRVMKTSQH